MLGLGPTQKDVKEILKLELSAETRDLKTVLKRKDQEMKEAAKNLEFELATILRDEMSEILKEIKKREKEQVAATVPKIRRPARHGKTH